MKEVRQVRNSQKCTKWSKEIRIPIGITIRISFTTVHIV